MITTVARPVPVDIHLRATRIIRAPRTQVSWRARCRICTAAVETDARFCGMCGASSIARPRLVFPHTPAFELEPPRIVIDLAAAPEPERAVRSHWWKLWAVALVLCGVGLGTAVVGCV